MENQTPKNDDIDKIKINEIDSFNFDFKIGHLSDFKLKPFKKSKKYNLFNIKVDKKTTDQTIENLKVQYADINNLKEVTSKSSVYCEFIYSENKKKGLLALENLDKTESKKILKRKVDDAIVINLKKLVKNDSELLNQVIGDTVNFDEFPNTVNVKIENIIERSPAKLTPTFDKIFGPGKVKTKKSLIKKLKNL